MQSLGTVVMPVTPPAVISSICWLTQRRFIRSNWSGRILWCNLCWGHRIATLMNMAKFFICLLGMLTWSAAGLCMHLLTRAISCVLCLMICLCDLYCLKCCRSLHRFMLTRAALTTRSRFSFSDPLPSLGDRQLLGVWEEAGLCPAA